jgi:hypothetical protein
MARKQRKLFPAPLATNQTVDCEPFNCEPFPDYYYIPPPPPPPPSLSGAAHSNPIHHISPYLIISFSFLAGVLVLVCYYVVIARSCPSWCSRRRNDGIAVPSQSDGTDQDFLDETQVDHPIWFITTVGLQQSVISSIAVCKYKKNEGLIEGTECSVCLNEFQENETLRLLPKCSHAFHIPCIDTWLRSHTNCPLCRANILTDTVNLDIVRHPLGSIDQNPNSLNVNEETHMTNSGNESDLRDYQVRNRELSENRAGTGDEGEFAEVDSERTSKEGGGDHAFCPEDSEGSSINRIEDAEKSLFLDNVAMQDGRRSGMHRLMGSQYSSIEQSLHIRPLAMKRSFSGSGRVLSLRFNRSQSSIL